MKEASEKKRKEIEALDVALDQETHPNSTSFVFFSYQGHRWETIYNEEIADQLKGDNTCLDTLVSLTASLPMGLIQIHSGDTNKTALQCQGKLSKTKDASGRWATSYHMLLV